MKVSRFIQIFAMVFTTILVSRFIYSVLKKTSIKVKSVSFRTHADGLLTIGDKSTYVPFAGEGMYAISVTKKFSQTSVKTLHMGILTVGSFQKRLEDMDEFFTRSVYEGASVLTVLSIGTTHVKPTLEVMRVGIAHGEFSGTADILRKYGMNKFIGFGHGVRQPYIMIKDVNSDKTVSERTGSLGGKLALKSVA